MEAFAQIISQLGFPIFVALYMLVKTSKDSEKTNETISQLTVAITELTTLIKGEKNEQSR